MKIVMRLFSGLGNQLFQYAAGCYYARRYSVQVELSVEENATSHGYPRPFMLSHFSINAPFHPLNSFERFVLTHKPNLETSSSALRSSLGIQVIAETSAQQYSFLPDLPIHRPIRTLYLVGYWQVHQMADELGDQLRSELTVREPARGKNLQVLEQIHHAANPVSLHIRRGDYLLDAEGNIALPIDYYDCAIRFFRDLFEDPTFFVFSDDIDFARKSFAGDASFVFVDHNDSFSAQEDLRLMSSCHDHIIANSSFSWWGAWLNPRRDKIVFAPKYWHLKSSSYYPNLLPPSWTIMAPQDYRSAQDGVLQSVAVLQ